MLAQARHDKETTYPELINSRRCRLLWRLRQEVDGAKMAARRLKKCAFVHVVATTLAWQRRWTRMLSTACSLSFAASLVEPTDSCTTWCQTGGEAPLLAELFGQDPSFLVV